VHVVDHDRRGESGEEGCGIQLGASGFGGEAQRRATMSREENLGEIGFAHRSGSVE
jgi:hypothetical protein